MREPRDAVALARTGAVLDEVIVAAAARLGVGQKFPHHHQLMKAREDELLLARLLVALEVQVVLDQLQQRVRLEHARLRSPVSVLEIHPQVGRREPLVDDRVLPCRG